ncbi:MAG TPA: carbamoyltransferase HypF [Candidatus Tumulicola sp.]|nr:carbamoyltransferase HypF [Candidatus Tumulicola sp.]
MKTIPAPTEAVRVLVGGIVQGVGFRPFVYRLARSRNVRGWVLNGETGVEIHAEGDPGAVADFVRAIPAEAPAASRIASLEELSANVEGFESFEIRASAKSARPTVRMSPDLPVCDACLRELFDPADRRYRYPYINCTNCGPRYSIVLGLPYDRPQTTMGSWPMCADCAAEYHDPANRRFHAQPVACPACGPAYYLKTADGAERGPEAIDAAAALLRAGAIVAIKGLGGYHLACDARRPESVERLRERKYRKERPFAVMARDLATARTLASISAAEAGLLESLQRPIVLLRAREALAGVAPENRDLGIMLPYTPLHHLLFAANAPRVLVMTSANRSSEPIAYTDEDAFDRLSGIADAFLAGEREIARRIDDSVTAAGPYGTAVLRHARGYAPQAVARVPNDRPLLCVGADLKSAVTLVVGGQAFAGQHIGDLDHYAAFEAFQATIADLLAIYEVPARDLLVVHDAHPEYVSTQYALGLGDTHRAVQHHRAHVASVLAEREAFDVPAIGVAFDGTGYGDDGTIWGGEVFVGSLRDGFTRTIALRAAKLPGGDAAARHPVQAAAGFLSALDDLPDLTAAPFGLGERYVKASRMVRSGVRTFTTTSMGRLFDTVAALLGFTRPITFEAQAAMWLEQLAWAAPGGNAYPFPLIENRLDFRPLLAAIVADRRRGRDVREIARGFHEAVAGAVLAAVAALEPQQVVASGGVFQNALLVELLAQHLGQRLWLNRRVPANDGGISLGQAGIAAVHSGATCP